MLLCFLACLGCEGGQSVSRQCCALSALATQARDPGCSLSQLQTSAALRSLRGGGSEDEEVVPLRTKSSLHSKRHARSFPAALMPLSLACQSMGIDGVEEGDLKVLLDDWHTDRSPRRIPEDFPTLHAAFAGVQHEDTISVEWGEHWSGELGIRQPLRVQGGWTEGSGFAAEGSGGQPQLDGQLVIDTTAQDSIVMADDGGEAWRAGFSQIDVSVEATLVADIVSWDFTGKISTVLVRSSRWAFDMCAVRSRHGVSFRHRKFSKV